MERDNKLLNARYALQDTSFRSATADAIAINDSSSAHAVARSDRQLIAPSAPSPAIRRAHLTRPSRYSSNSITLTSLTAALIAPTLLQKTSNLKPVAMAIGDSSTTKANMTISSATTKTYVQLCGYQATFDAEFNAKATALSIKKYWSRETTLCHIVALRFQYIKCAIREAHAFRAAQAQQDDGDDDGDDDDHDNDSNQDDFDLSDDDSNASATDSDSSNSDDHDSPDKDANDDHVSDMSMHLNSKTNVALADLTFPTMTDILYSQEIFIIDTAATIDTTPHNYGLFDTGSIHNKVITMGNQTVANIDLIGKLKVIFSNKYDHLLYNGVLSHIAYTPACAYNLFSVLQRMRDGWSIRNDATNMWLEKPNKHSIVFDIVIPTKRGQLYCIHLRRQQTTLNAQAPISDNRSRRHCQDQPGTPF